MMKIILSFLLFALPVFAQSQSSDTTAAAGCGPAKARFEVKVDAKDHSLKEPGAGKALIYVIQQGRPRNADSAVTTRVGVDGNWVGANHGESYMTVEVAPGDHHVCVDWQSSLSMRKKLGGATLLTVEAGKSYFLKTEVVMSQATEAHDEQLNLSKVDAAEGALLVSKAGKSSWTLKP